MGKHRNPKDANACIPGCFSSSQIHNFIFCLSRLSSKHPSRLFPTQALTSAVLKMPSPLTSHLSHRGFTRGRKKLHSVCVPQLTPCKTFVIAFLHTRGLLVLPSSRESPLSSAGSGYNVRILFSDRAMWFASSPRADVPSCPNICDLLSCSS